MNDSSPHTRPGAAWAAIMMLTDREFVRQFERDNIILQACAARIDDRIDDVPLKNGGMAHIQRPIVPACEGFLGADEDAEKSYAYRVSIGPMEIQLRVTSTRRPNIKMVADADVNARLDVTLRTPLHGAASGSVSGTLRTVSSSGDGMCNNNDARSGLHVKVAHPFVEGGDVGLRLVHVLDGSDLDPDLNLNPGHGHGHDCAAILHWSFTALGQSYVDEIKLFCLSGI